MVRRGRRGDASAHCGRRSDSNFCYAHRSLVGEAPAGTCGVGDILGRGP